MVQQLKAVGVNAKPSAANLQKLLSSLNATGGYEQLMSLLYNATSTVNGYNADGHYVRAQPLSSSTTNYSPSCAAGGCSSAHFQHDVAALPARDRQVLLAAAHRRQGVAGRRHEHRPASPVAGLWSYLTGRGQVRRRRGRETSFLQSPVLIGALTVLVVIVAVALAYRANTGLPFTPTYNLHVQMRDASELQTGDDVNEGGALVGLVSGITATRDRAGKPVADVNLKLHKNVEPLPADTRFTARLKGSIGVKYLEIDPVARVGSCATGRPCPSARPAPRPISTRC